MHKSLAGLLLLLAAVLVSGCSSMKFVNGPEMPSTVEREQWHHLGLNGIVEYSRPMDLQYNCDQQQWNTATVEYSFFNALASVSIPAPISLYNPWTIIYQCREPID